MKSQYWIYAISGGVGGGKSYCAVDLMANHVGEGGVIYSNIILDAKGFPALVRSRTGWSVQQGQVNVISDDDVWRLHEVVSPGTDDMPVMVVVDEVLDHFDSLDRDKNKTRFRDFFTVLRHIRKLNIQIYFITQEFMEINSRIRTKVQQSIVCEDGRRIKMPYIKCPIPPPWRWCFLRKLFSKGEKNLLQMDWIMKDKMVYAAYQTNALHTKVSLGGPPRKKYVRKDRMTKRELTVLYFALLLSVLSVGIGVVSLRRKGDVVERVVYEDSVGQSGSQEEVAMAEVVTEKSAEKEVVVRAYGYAEYGGRAFAILDGREVGVGDVVLDGIIVHLEKGSLVVKRWDDSHLVILRKGVFQNEDSKEIRVAKDDGRNGAAGALSENVRIPIGGAPEVSLGKGEQDDRKLGLARGKFAKSQHRNDKLQSGSSGTSSGKRDTRGLRHSETLQRLDSDDGGTGFGSIDRRRQVGTKPRVGVRPEPLMGSSRILGPSRRISQPEGRKLVKTSTGFKIERVN